MLVEAIRSPEVVQLSQGYNRAHNRTIESSSKPATLAAQAGKVAATIVEPGKAVQAPATVSESVRARTAVPEKAPASTGYVRLDDILRATMERRADDRKQQEKPADQDTLNRQLEAATRAFVDGGQEKRDIFLDEATGHLAMRVVDKDTGKVLRQVPPEQLLKMIAHLRESIGTFIDHQS